MPLDLAIAVLFWEKADQTIACVESFLPSGCRIFVLNNGSSLESSTRFEAWSRSHPQVVLLTSQTNLGVSAGRNLLVDRITSEWILFVDNDISLATPDFTPLFCTHRDTRPEIDIFVPRLFNVHDGCYAEYRSLQLVNNRAVLVVPESSCINLFPGGACFIRRSLFQRIGNYDERMFIGFEDFELSLRAMLAGTPLQVLLISDIELIHDHLIGYSSRHDISTALNRYDKDIIRASYELINTKYAVEIFDQWEMWVDNQVLSIKKHNRFGMNAINESECNTVANIALVVDQRGWAFSNIAEHIIRRLSGSFHFDVYYSADYGSDYDRLLSDIYAKKYDIVHFFWRDLILKLYIHILCNRLSDFDQITESFFNTKLTFSVYDHCLLEPTKIDNLQIIFKYLADGYVVSSDRLMSIYRKNSSYPDPCCVIGDGVDLTDFYPVNTERLLDNSRTIIVGWAGNSRWGMEKTDFDFKGFQSIIIPAIEELRAEGLNIEGKFADRNSVQIPYCEMVRYYNSIDIYLCASATEGTPNPILEAFACGIPVISTDVGIVPQLFGVEQKKFILNVRSKQELKDKLSMLARNPDLRTKLSAENLSRVKDWSREQEADKWMDFFNNVLSAHDQTKQLLKHACLDVPCSFGIEATIGHFLKDSVSWKLTRPLRFVDWHMKRLKLLLKQKIGGGL